MKVNFITTESLDIVSGGWSGINKKLYEQLSNSLDTNYVGPINPTSFIFEKAFSKVQRLLGFKGDFHFFSGRRLQYISDLVHSRIDHLANYNFFFGQTPWVQCNFKQPYGVYLDAAFPTYLEIYSKPEQFDINDIERICKLEKEWLLNANNLFFGSQWALNEAQKHYSCEFANAQVVWVGGNIPIPEKDVYNGGLNFLFISLNFEKKGGHICFAAFKQIKAKYPDATLTIIGEQPPISVLNYPGIIYEGKLNKKVPADLVKFISILERAFFLIHPTTMDTMGAVLIEAGYYGCPAIAPNSFGIPELVKDKLTGIIVDLPINADKFSNEIIKIMNDKKQYLQLRKNSREYTLQNLTWDEIGNKIIKSILNNHYI